jgi:hypothetical protein
MSKSYSERMQEFLIDNLLEENSKETETDNISQFMQFLMLHDVEIESESFNKEKKEELEKTEKLKKEDNKIEFIDFRKYYSNKNIQSRIINLKQKILDELE